MEFNLNDILLYSLDKTNLRDKQADVNFYNSKTLANKIAKGIIIFYPFSNALVLKKKREKKKRYVSIFEKKEKNTKAASKKVSDAEK